jgi:hypothetical protein
LAATAKLLLQHLQLLHSAQQRLAGSSSASRVTCCRGLCSGCSHKRGDGRRQGRGVGNGRQTLLLLLLLGLRLRLLLLLHCLHGLRVLVQQRLHAVDKQRAQVKHLLLRLRLLLLLLWLLLRLLLDVVGCACKCIQHLRRQNRAAVVLLRTALLLLLLLPLRLLQGLLPAQLLALRCNRLLL